MEASLERSETFSEFNKNVDIESGETDYQRFPEVTLNDRRGEDDAILDVETINWTVLLTRILAIFLLILIIVFCGLEDIDQKFLWLACIVCAVLIVVIVGTYIDLRNYCCPCCKRRPKQAEAKALNNPLLVGTNSSASYNSSHMHQLILRDSLHT